MRRPALRCGPGSPPLPGGQNSNPGHIRGNPNGGSPALPQLFPSGNGANVSATGVPTLQQLFPPGAVQAVSQVEEVVIPSGLPRPSQVLLGPGPGAKSLPSRRRWLPQRLRPAGPPWWWRERNPLRGFAVSAAPWAFKQPDLSSQPSGYQFFLIAES